VCDGGIKPPAEHLLQENSNSKAGVRQSMGRVPGMRASTIASQACGSISLGFAVYADRRTMPNGLVFPRIRSDQYVIGSA
jgi:hypothetical protein